MFTIIKKDETSSARAGVLSTAHGIVETPAYVIVGTHAAVRCLSPDELVSTKTQIVIANTYHLWRALGDNISSFEGLHERMGWNKTIMTDSGGFQVFSLGFGREHGVGKVLGGGKKKTGENLTRVSEEGVFFRESGKEYFLGPEISIAVQKKLGADIILAFDECTSPEHDYAYQREALARTHRWAKICLSVNSGNDQKLYGIVQGGVFEDLRKESSRSIGGLPFDGFAIGGSFGEEKMKEVIRWGVSALPEEKPRHLLGIGRIENILDGVAEGVDTFDCVIPTREARHGGLWTRTGRVDVKKSGNKNSSEPVEKHCLCSTCAAGITRGMFFDMFHSRDMRAGEYATVHNVFFFNTFMEELRAAIKNGTFSEFSKKTRRVRAIKK